MAVMAADTSLTDVPSLVIALIDGSQHGFPEVDGMQTVGELKIGPWRRHIT